MSLVNVKKIKEEAEKEIREEAELAAIEKLKELYRKKEKAALVLKNINREIEAYLNDIPEQLIYEEAGVNNE